MKAIGEHFWVLGIVVTFINTAVWWLRGRSEINRQPELREGYRALIRGFLVFGNLPWIVMGIGIVFGGVPNLFAYFNARNGPFVVAFYATLAVLWVLMLWWLFFRDGAESLARHPGLLRGVESPGAIKAFAVIAVVGGAIALGAMITGRVPGRW